MGLIKDEMADSSYTERVGSIAAITAVCIMVVAMCFVICYRIFMGR